MNEIIKQLILKTGSYTAQKMIRQSEILRHPCSRCGAGPSEPCLGYNGAPRISSHMERVAIALGHPIDSLIPTRKQSSGNSERKKGKSMNTSPSLKSQSLLPIHPKAKCQFSCSTSVTAMTGNWHVPAAITRNNFIHQSLCSFAYNVAVGYNHSCCFWGVPGVSTKTAPSTIGRSDLESSHNN